VYQLPPGNANRLTEECALDFDPRASAEVRSWIDCDMMFRGEVPHERLRVVLLRVPTVLTTTDEIFFHPTLSSIGHESWLGSFRPDFRPMGYDPMCALISDEDIAHVTSLALHSRHAGVYNVAGLEAQPLSTLSGRTGRWELPVPGPLLYAALQASRVTGAGWLRVATDARQLRHGFTLDTTKAERELGFKPGYRIRLARSGSGQPPTEAATL
jgi:nucleoside-diphosphate-sugar epimerase